MGKVFNFQFRRIAPRSCITASCCLIAVIAAILPEAYSQGRSIIVVTEPNAVVWIDDVRFGRTDSAGRLAIRKLSAGRHNVRVRADGFHEASRAMLPTEKGEVRVALAKTIDPAELAYQEAERLASSYRKQAAATYRRAIGLRPAYVAAYIGSARVLSDDGDTDGALVAIRNLRKYSPRNAEASAIEGRIYKDIGEEQKAIASFKRSIGEGAGFQPEAYTGLGLLYKEKAESSAASGNLADEDANYIESAKYFASAVNQLSGAPDATVVYQLLGLVYERQKRYADAIRLYNDFLAVFPESNDATAVRSFIEQIKKQMAQPE